MPGNKPLKWNSTHFAKGCQISSQRFAKWQMGTLIAVLVGENCKGGGYWEAGGYIQCENNY